jgi:hypothetical protein
LNLDELNALEKGEGEEEDKEEVRLRSLAAGAAKKLLSENAVHEIEAELINDSLKKEEDEEEETEDETEDDLGDSLSLNEDCCSLLAELLRFRNYIAYPHHLIRKMVELHKELEEFLVGFDPEAVEIDPNTCNGHCINCSLWDTCGSSVTGEQDIAGGD